MVSRYLHFRYKGFQSISLPSKQIQAPILWLRGQPFRYQFGATRFGESQVPIHGIEAQLATDACFIAEPWQPTDGTALQVPQSGQTPNFAQHQLITNCSQMAEKTKTSLHMKFDVLIKNLLLVFMSRNTFTILQRCRNTPISLLLILQGISPIFAQKFQCSVSLQ